MATKNQPTTSRQFSDFEGDIIEGLLSGKPLGGRDGVLTDLIKHVIETAMDAELGDHLRQEASQLDAKSNKRNGKTSKRLNTDFGPTTICPSRDRLGSYESQIVGKWQHDLAPNLSRQILSLYARGTSYRDIAAHLEDIFGQSLSPASISTVVEAVWEDVQKWQKRPLDACYVAVFMDAIHFKVRLEGKSTSVAVYIFYGIDVQGRRDILSMHVGQGSESASQWSVFVAELKERGVEDVKAFVADGLPGLVDVVSHHFPSSDFQRCVVHKVRNSVVGVDYKDRKAVCKDLRTVYTAGNEQEARTALDDFAKTWKKYPHIVKSWLGDWTELMAFMDYGPEMRRLMYTTNALENVNRNIRKSTKSKGSWTSTKALTTQIYLIIQATEAAWGKTVRNFAAVQRELIERHGDDYLKYLTE